MDRCDAYNERGDGPYHVRWALDHNIEVFDSRIPCLVPPRFRGTLDEAIGVATVLNECLKQRSS